jgi:putative methylase
MNRRHLEILLSQHIQSFSNPKAELEQYQTPARVAANLLHFAHSRGSIENKRVVDVCAGTGILGLGAALLGGDVTLIDIDPEATALINSNADELEVDIDVVTGDIFSLDLENKFDTALINPPFGIQQQHHRDLDFIEKVAEITGEIYSIHDGSPANVEQLPQLLKKIGVKPQGYYLDEFPLDQVYNWHQSKTKLHTVMVIYSLI